MGGSAEAYQHYVMGRQGGQPSRHASLVCLSECCYDDRRPLLLVEQSLLGLRLCLMSKDPMTPSLGLASL